MRHPCFNIWYGDFRAKTGHLNGQARAFYLVLLCEAWSRSGSLPNDDRAIRLMLGLSAYQWVGIRDEVMAFWTLAEDGRWHNKRLDKEWKKAERRFKDEPLARAIAREETPSNQGLSDSGKNTSLKSLRKTRSASHHPRAKTAAKSIMRPKQALNTQQNSRNRNSPSALQETRRAEREKPNGAMCAHNAPAHNAHARADDPFPTELSALRAERVLSETQSTSEAAAALSVGHAAQPPPNSESKTPTIFPYDHNAAHPAIAYDPSDPSFPVTFLEQNSPAWIAYQRNTGKTLKPFAIHEGKPGQWILKPNP